MSRLRIRRILVAMDASRASSSTARAAASLASRLEAELTALFVIDASLLDLARSPVARHVDWVSSAPSRLRNRELEMQLRAEATRARRAFERIAARAAVRATFRTVRGEVAAQILDAAAEVDLVALGRGAGRLRRGTTLGSVARAVVSQRPRQVVMVGDEGLRVERVSSLHDGSTAGRDALALAREIAERLGVPLDVLVLAADDGVADRIAGELGDESAPGKRETRIRRLPTERGAWVDRVAGEAGLLVLPVASPLLAGERLVEVIERARGTVLAVS